MIIIIINLVNYWLLLAMERIAIANNFEKKLFKKLWKNIFLITVLVTVISFERWKIVVANIHYDIPTALATTLLWCRLWIRTAAPNQGGKIRSSLASTMRRVPCRLDVMTSHMVCCQCHRVEGGGSNATAFEPFQGYPKRRSDQTTVNPNRHWWSWTARIGRGAAMLVPRCRM